MAFFIFLIVIYLVAVLIVLPFWTINKIGAMLGRNDELNLLLGNLEKAVKKLRKDQSAGASLPPVPNPKRESEVSAAAPMFASKPEVPPLPVVVSEPKIPDPQPPELPKSLGKFPVISEFVPRPADDVTPVSLPQTPDETPESAPAPIRVALAVQPPGPSLMDSINWEQFIGAKLFAWLGGLALFLAVALFVKYSFEHDLIPASVRVAIGFVFGAGLVVGGLKIPREKYAVTAQTLIAVGIVSLYAVTFSCRSIYHFEFFARKSLQLSVGDGSAHRSDESGRSNGCNRRDEDIGQREHACGRQL